MKEKTTVAISFEANKELDYLKARWQKPKGTIVEELIHNASSGIQAVL